MSLNQSYAKPYPRAIGEFTTDVEIYYNEHLHIDQVPQRIRNSVGHFLRVLEQNRLLTFGAMIRHATEHLQANGPVDGLLALYVDEYQDVNPAQVSLLKAMISSQTSVIVVGDDLQSIYNWRGSDVTRILHFPNEFSPASVCRLSTNYRSRPQIVTLSNRVASFVQIKDLQKVMKPSRNRITLSGGTLAKPRIRI